jgi:hypothetical protein
MDTVGPGPHTYTTISDLPGTNPVDTLTFIIDVQPSHILQDVGDATTTVNPTSIVRFSNYSPDSVAVDFRASPDMLGLEVQLLNNQQVVPSGQFVDVLVEFYTAAGYVATPGQELSATVTAYEGHKDGSVLAFTSASAFASTVLSVPSTSPQTLALRQNVPNPFRDRTQIAFEVPNASRVQLRIYDVQGRLVRTLDGGQVQGPTSSFEWQGRDDRGHRLPSGVYSYRLIVNGEPTLTRKAVVLR